jgi:hypothetical protein
MYKKTIVVEEELLIDYDLNQIEFRFLSWGYLCFTV